MWRANVESGAEFHLPDSMVSFSCLLWVLRLFSPSGFSLLCFRYCFGSFLLVCFFFYVSQSMSSQVSGRLRILSGECELNLIVLCLLQFSRSSHQIDYCLPGFFSSLLSIVVPIESSLELFLPFPVSFLPFPDIRSQLLCHSLNLTKGNWHVLRNPIRISQQLLRI